MIKRLASKAFTAVCIVFWLWVALSYVNVLATRPNVPKWNFFKVLTSHAESKPLMEQSGIAFHEWLKGQQKLVIEPAYNYTAEDVEIMARIIESEAGAD